MKKNKTLFAVLLSVVCIVCAAFCLSACIDGGVEETVVKAGDTEIGTVTAEGADYSVEGTVGTVYSLTAKVGEEVAEGVTLKVGDHEGTAITFVYATNCKVNVKADTDDVENVTLTLEALNTLTADKTVTVTDVKTGDFIPLYFVVESGKTYTVTSNSEDVEFWQPLGNVSSYVVNGDDSDNPITSLRAVASADVSSVTFTLTVADTETGGSEGQSIELDTPYTVNCVADGEPVKFNISLEAGNYQITFGGDDADVAEVTAYAGDDLFFFTSINDTNMLPAGDYTLSCEGVDIDENWNFVSVNANYTITITKIGEWDDGSGGGDEGGEFDPSTLEELQVGENTVEAKLYKIEITTAGNYTFTIEGQDFLIGGGYSDFAGEVHVSTPFVIADAETGVYALEADVYYVEIYSGTSLTITLVTE